MDEPYGVKLLRELLQAHRESDRESMSHASVAHLVQNQNLQLHNARRHNAQVDAMLQAKYAECGMPDVYQPPQAEDSDMATMINCTFNSDKAVEQIANTIADVGTGEGQQPTQPQPPPPPPPQKRPSIWRWLAPLLGVALGAGITLAAIALLSGDDGQQEIIALPFQPDREIDA